MCFCLVKLTMAYVLESREKESTSVGVISLGYEGRDWMGRLACVGQEW